MKSKIYFVYQPNGNIVKVESNDDKLYQGQVGTAEYRIDMAEANNANNWQSGDTVFISFIRPDLKTASQLMTYDGTGWYYLSNGWETDCDISEVSDLSVSFVMRRYSTLDSTLLVANKTTEAATVSIYPTAGYTPLNIASGDIDAILTAIGEHTTQIETLDENLTEAQSNIIDLQNNKVDKTTTIAGVDLQNNITASELKIGLSLNNVDNTSDVNKPVSTAQQAAIDEAESDAKTYAQAQATYAVGLAQLDAAAKYIPLTQKGAESGVCPLGSDSKVSSTYLPSYVDDIIEVASYSELPETGESGKIYVTLDTNLTYRWSGSAYVEISQSLALGETSSTAYRGDRGKELYDFVSPAFEEGKDLQDKFDEKTDYDTYYSDFTNLSTNKANKSDVYRPFMVIDVTDNAYTVDTDDPVNYSLTNSQDVALTIIGPTSGKHFIIELHGGYALTLPTGCKTDISFGYTVVEDNTQYYRYEFLYNGTVWEVTRNVFNEN